MTLPGLQIRDFQPIDALEITWPSGETQTLHDVRPDQLLLIREGQSAVEAQLAPS